MINGWHNHSKFQGEMQKTDGALEQLPSSNTHKLSKYDQTLLCLPSFNHISIKVSPQVLLFGT
jgi:hypothetical protein